MTAILTINAGSSSIKFSIYQGDRVLYSGAIEDLLETPISWVRDAMHQEISRQSVPAVGHEAALQWLCTWISQHEDGITISAISHRIVHGGRDYSDPVRITPQIQADLQALIPLAPLHQPYNLDAVTAMQKLYPQVPHIACFDTAFHNTQSMLQRLYPLPRHYRDEGILRYGFHGLSYAYIASVLPGYLGDRAEGKIIVCHLGNGASMCAMESRKSVATSMGFTALEGLMMGTRAGSLDPGIVLYLLQEKNMTVKDIERLLYKESGLLGISGISSDMKILEESSAPQAQEAIDLFCLYAAREIGLLAASLQGVEVIVFTAGIGEHSALVRQKIGRLSTWLGVEIDEAANKTHAASISSPASKVAVMVIPTNEELMLAKYALAITQS